MKTSTRILAALLALLMLCSIMVSCKKKNADGEAGGTTAGGNGAATTVLDDEAAKNEEQNNLPEEKKYDYEYIMLSDSNGSGELFHYIDENNKPSGDVINNALFMRKALMQDLYDVTLSVNKDANYKTTLANTASAGLYVCDISMVKASDTFALALQGIYANLLDLDALNLDASYWDQRIQSEYRMNDMLFTLEGDHTYNDEMTTLVVVYNETVYEQQKLVEKYGTPYEMVSNYTWTYGTLMEMIKDMASDSEADGRMNELDTWGMVSELTASYYFFLGAGKKTLENQNGQFTLTLKDPGAYSQIYDVIEETMTMMQNPDIIIANMPGHMDTSEYWTAASDILKYDRALLRTTTLSAVTRLKDMKSNYGILPVPAFYDDQTEYYCWVSGNTHKPLAIMKNVDDLAVTAEITERLAYHSRYGTDTLYSAFYDHLAYSRLGRTDNDIKMLDLIFASKTYDIDQATKITGVEPAMYSLAKAQNFTTLTSTLSGLVEASDTKLNSYLIEMIAKNS